MIEKLKSILKKEIRIPGLKPLPISPLWGKRITKATQLLALLVVSLFLIWRITLGVQVHERLASLKARGLPASGAELNAWRIKVPDHQNGATVVQRACSMIETRVPGWQIASNTKTPVLITFVSGSTGELLRAYVQTNRLSLAKAAEAMAFTQFQYPVDFSYGIETEFPHLRSLKSLTQLVALDSVLQAEAGNSNGWAQSVRLQLKLAESLAGEPSLISCLARSSIIESSVKTLERNLNLNSPDEHECELLQNEYAGAAKTNPIPVALMGERAMQAPFFRMSWTELRNLSKESRKPQRYTGKPALILWLPGILERDLNFCLKTMDHSIALASAPAPKHLIVTNYFDQASETGGKYFFSEMLLPAISRAVVRETRGRAQASLASAAVAVERFRQQTGKLPDGLQQLVPSKLAGVPMDPFTGKSMHYKLLQPGYCIYSVGSDGQDNGGKQPPVRIKSRDTNHYDVVFTVKR